jgi:hypothetical protein
MLFFLLKLNVHIYSIVEFILSFNAENKVFTWKVLRNRQMANQNYKKL